MRETTIREKLKEKKDQYKKSWERERKRSAELEKDKEQLKKKIDDLIAGSVQRDKHDEKIMTQIVSYLIYDQEKEEDPPSPETKKQREQETEKDQGDGDEAAKKDSDNDNSDNGADEGGNGGSGGAGEKKSPRPRSRKSRVKKMVLGSVRDAAREEGHILFRSMKFMNNPTMAARDIVMSVYKRAKLDDKVKMVRWAEGVKMYMIQHYSDMKRVEKKKICSAFMGE